MLGSSLTTEVSYRDGLPVVHAAGEVDLATAPLLKNVLDELIRTGRPSIVLDLQQVSYFDASGLNVLLGIRRGLDPAGGILKLVSPTRPVSRILQLIGFDSLFPVYPSLDQALGNAEHAAPVAIDPGREARQIEITIQSRPEMVGKVRKTIDRMAQHDGLPEADVEDIKLALSEACTNAILHGSPQGPRNYVGVRYRREHDRVVIEVRDQGAGFHIQEGDVIWPDGLEEGRRGLFLIRTLMDHVSYSPSETGGVLRMEKCFSERAIA